MHKQEDETYIDEPNSSIKILSENGLLIIFAAILIYDVVRAEGIFNVSPILAILMMITVVLVGLVPYVVNNSSTRRVITLTSVHILWLIMLALFIPFDSPYWLVNFMLVFFAADLLEYFGVIVSVGLLALGVELGILRQADTLYLSDVSIAVVHVVLLLLFGLITANVKRTQHRLAIGAISTAHEVQSERERLVALINSMTDGVIATNIKGQIIVYNGAALDILNINTSLEGLDIADYIHLKNKDNKNTNILKLAKSTESFMVSRDYKLAIKNDNDVKLYLSIAPVRLGYGKNNDIGYIILIRDITKEKSLEEERDEFISVVSHELRTPTAIAEGNLSNADFLLRGLKGHTDVKESINDAHNQVIFLSGLINDLATLSRAERGKLQASPENVNSSDLLEELESIYKIEANSKGLKIILEKSPRNLNVSTAKLYLKEILQNFITNSIKYTQKGYISLGAEKYEKGVVFIVSDTGIGISNSDKSKLFDKFFRSEDYRTRESSGTGLGLYVTKKLADIIHANIEVESEINKGSKFRIYVPNID